MTVATFALVHLAALPWAVEGTRARTTATTNDGVRQMRTAGFRVFVGITAATLVLVALSGMAGWAWLLLQ
jgi:hypothetical protein